MAEVKELYSVLGVSAEATDDDIRRAYRRLARELHPDVNGDPAAQERFKQVTAAYEVLSDPQKRRRYDSGASSLQDLFPFGDIFDAFFGGGFGRRAEAPRASRARQGADVFTSVTLTLEEVVAGAQREIPIESMETCSGCAGTGREPDTGTRRCTRCKGTGEIQDVQRSIFGTIMTARTCPTCEGSGEEILTPCVVCGGDGRVSRRQVVTVDVPPGVSDGIELRVSGAGDEGRDGALAGDLYVGIKVLPHEHFERRGQDLHAILELPMTHATLGAEIDVATLDGIERVKLYPGTQSGEVIRLRGHGVPNLGRRGRGDVLLTVHVRTPENMHREEKKAIERLAELRGEKPQRGERVPGRLRRPGAPS
jgi:molecular chaperone DnaJ